MHGKTYLCTGNIVVHWKTYVCIEKYICALEIYLCTGKVICALGNLFLHWKIYLCTEKYICALGNLFVHWKTYLCTEKYIFTLGNLLVHRKTYLCTENIYLCTQKHVRNVFRSIYMHWNFYLCIAYMGHRSFHSQHASTVSVPPHYTGEISKLNKAKNSFSKCFPSMLKLKASLFKFIRFEERWKSFVGR